MPYSERQFEGEVTAAILATGSEAILAYIIKLMEGVTGGKLYKGFSVETLPTGAIQVKVTKVPVTTDLINRLQDRLSKQDTWPNLDAHSEKAGEVLFDGF